MARRNVGEPLVRNRVVQDVWCSGAAVAVAALFIVELRAASIRWYVAVRDLRR